MKGKGKGMFSSKGILVRYTLKMTHALVIIRLNRIPDESKKQKLLDDLKNQTNEVHTCTRIYT